jgi:putative tricarboxylic transport membrane protein
MLPAPRSRRLAHPVAAAFPQRLGRAVAWLAILLGCALGGTALAAPAATAGKVHFLIPAAPGSGWDGPARAAGQALQQARIVDQVSYENLSGGGGGRAVARLIELGPRASETLLVSSTPIIVRALPRTMPQSYRDLTPVAAIAADYSTFAVRADSPYRDFASLLAAWKKDPRRVPTGGGSVRGNMDHLVAAMVLGAAGGQPRTLVYLPYDGGGKALAALLAGEVQVVSTGIGEVLELARSGKVRLLAVTAPRRVARLPNVPTLREVGVDAQFVNWRGLFGPPRLPAATRALQVRRLRAMHASSQWAALRDRHAWEPLFIEGDEFSRYLARQEAELARVMRRLGFLR